MIVFDNSSSGEFGGFGRLHHPCQGPASDRHRARESQQWRTLSLQGFPEPLGPAVGIASIAAMLEDAAVLSVDTLASVQLTKSD
jgi:hypothetical protein